MKEREAKLAAPPGFRLPTFQGDTGIEGLTPLARPEQQYRSMYMDTEDLRLARWGASLRHRSEEGWTLKLPGRVADGLVRDEHLFKGEATSVPSEAVDLVRAYVRSSPVKPVARLQTVRRGVQLADAEGRIVADIVDDEVSVFEGRRIASRFREVEAEIMPAAPKVLAAEIVDRLRAGGAGDPDPTPKVTRALGSAAAAPADVVVPELTSRVTAGDALRREVASSVLRLITHDTVIRLDADPEGVHQARVATRRLRSLLRSFGAFFDPDWAASLREELQWLADVLGAARDGDVRLERMGHRVDALPSHDAAAASWLRTEVDEARRESLEAALIALRSERYVLLLDRLVAAASRPELSEAAGVPAKELAPSVRHAWEGLRNRVRSSEPTPSDAELHRIRIHAKRLRYAAEAVAPVAGKRARAMAAAAEELQSVLGEFNDAIVAAWWLRERAARASDPAISFAAGEVAGAELEEAARTRVDWRKAWKATSAKRLRSWL